jgi:prephenate dehydrogenase
MIRITIIGMGLIGTSLGMALRSADESSAPLGKTTITGYDADPRHTSEARGRLAIDREARNLGEALRDANLVVVAVPVQAVRDVFRSIAPLLGPGTVVTDMASTKAEVLAWARELLPGTTDFVGGHPMAGREKSGPAAATADLFQNAIYCLTPTPTVRPQALELVEGMVLQAGAKVYFIDPHEHDAYVAGVSHLPFMLATALVESLSRSPSWREMMPLAANGFRDMTRLAAGDVVMHRDQPRVARALAGRNRARPDRDPRPARCQRRRADRDAVRARPHCARGVAGEQAGHAPRRRRVRSPDRRACRGPKPVWPLRPRSQAPIGGGCGTSDSCAGGEARPRRPRPRRQSAWRWSTPASSKPRR